VLHPHLLDKSLSGRACNSVYKSDGSSLAELAQVEYLSSGTPRRNARLATFKGPAAEAARQFLGHATGQAHLGTTDMCERTLSGITDWHCPLPGRWV
jgi:hypothetical protein